MNFYQIILKQVVDNQKYRLILHPQNIIFIQHLITSATLHLIPINQSLVFRVENDKFIIEQNLPQIIKLEFVNFNIEKLLVQLTKFQRQHSINMIEHIKNMDQFKYIFQKYSIKQKTSCKVKSVWINWEKQELRWSNENQISSSYSKISLRDITDIQYGFKSQNLQRYRFYPGLKFECCLSIYYMIQSQEQCLDFSTQRFIDLKQFLQILQDILVYINHPVRSYITNRQLCFSKAKMKLMQYANQKEKLTLNTYLKNKIFNRIARSLVNQEDIVANKALNRENDVQYIEWKSSNINLNQFKVDQQKSQNQNTYKRVQYQYNEIQTVGAANKINNSEASDFKKIQSPINGRIEPSNTNKILFQKDTLNDSYKNLKKVIQLNTSQQDRFQEQKYRKTKYPNRNIHLDFLHTSGSNKSLSVSEKSILNLTNGLLSPEIHNKIKQKIKISNQIPSGNIIQRYIKSSLQKPRQEQIRILDQFQSEKNEYQSVQTSEADQIQSLKLEIKELSQKIDEVSKQKISLEQNLKLCKSQLLKEKTLNAALKEQLVAFKNGNQTLDLTLSPIQKPFVMQTTIYSPSSTLIKNQSNKQSEDAQLIQNLQRQIQQERQQNSQLNSQIQDLKSIYKSVISTQTKTIKDQIKGLQSCIEDISIKQIELKKDFGASISQVKKIFSFLGNQIVDSERRALQLEKEKEDLMVFIDQYIKDTKWSRKSLSFLEEDKTTNYSTN
ncbi:hypothetical protein TTHERM_00046830 (macronuclear) [Tetrahymena thermophila SB210]|uniref:Uncharacterized protein n=1 Tax=Tetrahymena thermophila (strain SB210) TaxID=312017 RepID=Q23DK8_TETTS|nr:hypothetical protein TTHERM_00046830 [Tetrahymena thermophila SB210]EAR94628.2 hypothetical protein TTHERM_00046830 [Tetrahymena thermophila SB210]|eukprot:XP_001014678.2 hypothetical protein TTHERM_00046830 [Tetrahymena thermophila SB210]